jgi:hypothetical protein
MTHTFWPGTRRSLRLQFNLDARYLGRFGEIEGKQTTQQRWPCVCPRSAGGVEHVASIEKDHRLGETNIKRGFGKDLTHVHGVQNTVMNWSLQVQMAER